MAAPDPLDGILHLEHVAVGPYCVFDSFQPLSNPPSTIPLHSSSTLLETANQRMVDPIMTNSFAYQEGMRPSWFTTAADDMPLSAPSDDIAGANWSEFMAWDHNTTSQAPHVKLSGPVGVRKTEQQQSPIFDRRQDSPSNGIPTSTTIGSDPSIKAPFTFGENPELPSTFNFDANVSSSPSSGDGQQQQQGNFYPMWQQQQQVGDGSLFHQGMDQSRASVAPMQNMSSRSSLHQSQSPGSIRNGPISSPSEQSTPEPVLDNPKKRKSSTNDDDSTPNGKREKSQPPKKTAHNMIEKRYRTNLNDKIAALRDSVPSLRVMSRANGTGEEEDDPEDLEGLTPAHKLNKATVLSKATEYIRHLEKRNKRLQDEVTAMSRRIENYEKMAISGSMNVHGSVGTPDGSRYSEDPFTPSHSMSMSGPPQGMIPVPDHIAGLRHGLPPQGHYAAAYPQYSGASRPGQTGPPMVPGRRNTMMGKLIVGSLAGLMILEGVAERRQSKEEPSDRGLSALPFHAAAILAPRVSLGAANAQIPIAKVLLVFGALFYIIAPFFKPNTKNKKKTAQIVNLAQNPSLALPVEMRQKAWLTSIQTVWVPRHNFWLEVAALAIKTVKLSVRKIIGWDGYALLTGTTKEQEIARVKSWGIALDAQLTGGDAEISKSRLVLTLMASGTLPDTPARLMLKALHIRVLLWELAHAGHGLSWMCDNLSAKLSRRYWNMARSEQKIAANLASKPENELEPLPEHLAVLLEEECDDVLVPSIIQRAYNLAWNRPIAEHTSADPSMDGVVEDFAISSPLDALAAWYSSYRLKRGLVGYLGSRGGKVKDNIKTDLELAVQTAPPTSQAHVRSLVAQAVVLEDNTNARIATACNALPSPPTAAQSKQTTFMNLVGNADTAIDVRKALTLAKCHMLIQHTSVSARQRAAFVVNNTRLVEGTTTLLSFVAAYKVLNHFVQDPIVRSQTSYGLEKMASLLRHWVGHETGKQSGLGNRVRGRLVSRCLEASKMLVGLAEKEDMDPGYFSSSMKGDEVES
ncbi:unnamed protein product [Periconia digitata]|uniref:BHLH domain-containing protein n=1 Tax=Periconia digitata TaxID=1303443 RepID=A0A9W4XKX8_9PLEO|nr:unnamed protein product [Periconia digitata]